MLTVSRALWLALSFMALLHPRPLRAQGTGCVQAVAVDRWKGEYFPNTTLEGSPALVRDDGAQFLSLPWGSSGPNACGIGVDNFSARFTRVMYWNGGNYRFAATADDGIRLYVDGVLRIDRFIEQGPTTVTADFPLTAGNHALEVHYFEKGGSAVTQLSWEFLSALAAPLDASVLEGDSSVPSSLSPGETRQVRVRVKNTGTSTWTAADKLRLGTGPDNRILWSGFSCGGYANSAGDARAYLCSSVAPGATADFTFAVTAPSSGSAVLAVRMVKELVAWFGESQKWAIPVASNPCLQNVAGDRWKGEYFANTSLSGSPSLVRDDGAGDLGFDWGAGGPNTCGIGVDRYSARWTKSAVFSAGTYKFTTRADDGVRIYVDNALILDKWMVQAPTVYTADVPLTAGAHVVKVEYFEQGGGAVAQVSWPQAGGGTACPASVPADRWKGEYFANRDLSGAPTMARDEGAAFLNIDWGLGSPGPSCGLPVDGFSARFTRTLAFANETYRFTVRGDDGVRFYVDGQLKIDQWKDQGPTSYFVNVPLTAGNHTLRLDYYENGGGALAAVNWGRVAPVGEVKFGFHVLTYTDQARQEAARGARVFLIMDDFQGASGLKDAYPDAIVMVRKYWGTAVPSVEQLLSGLEGAWVPGLIYTGLNENDGIGNTGDALRTRARLDVDVARRIRDRSGATYAAGTFSMGTPDFTNPDVVQIIKELYAPAYNSGLIAFDMHLYSPTMEHIYDDNELKWFERRWEFLFTHCGFDPNVRAIYSSETGVDEGGVGGFEAHRGTPEQVAAWAKRFKEVQARPVVVNGVSYPSPFRGGAIFQLSGNQNSRWAGYEMARYLEALRPLY